MRPSRPQVSVVSSCRVTTNRTLGGRCAAPRRANETTRNRFRVRRLQDTEGFVSLSKQQVSVVAAARRRRARTSVGGARETNKTAGKRVPFGHRSRVGVRATTTTTTTHDGGRTVLNAYGFRCTYVGVQRRPHATWRRERVIEAAASRANRPQGNGIGLACPY